MATSPRGSVFLSPFVYNSSSSTSKAENIHNKTRTISASNPLPHSPPGRYKTTDTSKVTYSISEDQHLPESSSSASVSIDNNSSKYSEKLSQSSTTEKVLTNFNIGIDSPSLNSDLKYEEKTLEDSKVSISPSLLNDARIQDYHSSNIEKLSIQNTDNDSSEMESRMPQSSDVKMCELPTAVDENKSIQDHCTKELTVESEAGNTTKPYVSSMTVGEKVKHYQELIDKKEPSRKFLRSPSAASSVYSAVTGAKFNTSPSNSQLTRSKSLKVSGNEKFQTAKTELPLHVDKDIEKHIQDIESSISTQSSGRAASVYAAVTAARHNARQQSMSQLPTNEPTESPVTDVAAQDSRPKVQSFFQRRSPKMTYSVSIWKEKKTTEPVEASPTESVIDAKESKKKKFALAFWKNQQSSKDFSTVSTSKPSTHSIVTPATDGMAVSTSVTNDQYSPENGNEGDHFFSDSEDDEDSFDCDYRKTPGSSTGTTPRSGRKKRNGSITRRKI
jgi:hypothetical protein